MVTKSPTPNMWIGAVHLRVADLERQVSFYRDLLGFSVQAEDGATAALGAEGETPLLVLHAAPDARPRPPGSTGLFHVAFLLPTVGDLGGMIRRIRDGGGAFAGFADHHVSEAAYLNDPEGNGLELCVDRHPRGWRTSDGKILLETEPLDVRGLMYGAPGPASKLPRGTVVGHVHLRVSTLEGAEAFYVRRLGFDVVTRDYPGALFVSTGRYHHHLGFNVWGGEGAPPPPEHSLGLASFDVVVPAVSDRERILGDPGQGIVFDLDDNAVRIVRE
jgi:catechol 2,3-dioxygenase